MLLQLLLANFNPRYFILMISNLTQKSQFTDPLPYQVCYMAKKLGASTVDTYFNSTSIYLRDVMNIHRADRIKNTKDLRHAKTCGIERVR